LLECHGYSPTDFKFVRRDADVNIYSHCDMLISYYIVVFGGRELMKKREPFVLKYPFLVHNFYLTVISGVLLALFIEQLLPTVSKWCILLHLQPQGRMDQRTGHVVLRVCFLGFNEFTD